jgi:transcriptional regulator with XRE-family HTH domain
MNETFGQRFTRFRKQRNLTQEELGERIGVSG